MDLATDAEHTEARDPRMQVNINSTGDNFGVILGVNNGTINIGSENCLTAIYLTDPRADKDRITDTKGGLLCGSYEWILQHNAFEKWYDDEAVRLLWIKGDAGKGKTMLTIGIIGELEKRVQALNKDEDGKFQRRAFLCYYFFEGTNHDRDNAIAMLRTLIWSLIKQSQTFRGPLSEEFELYGSNLFEGPNAFESLSRILKAILEAASPTTVYVVIDALDECKENLEQMLSFINLHSSQLHVKWIVSSRNEYQIEKHLQPHKSRVPLSLEDDSSAAAAVSGNVEEYIDQRLVNISALEGNSSLYDAVRDIMRQKAEGTFLWVAIAMKELKDVEDVLLAMEDMRPGLKGLYSQMMERIENQHSKKECLRALSTVIQAYRPLHKLELGMLLMLTEKAPNLGEAVERILHKCGSYLTLRNDRVYVVHQSAKDYLNDEVFPSEHPTTHRDIFRAAVDSMTRVLKENIYSVPELDGFPQYGIWVEKIPTPDPDPLQPVRYACAHWIDHLEDSRDHTLLYGDGVLHDFLNGYFLYWLEAMSLNRQVNMALHSLYRLERLLRSHYESSALLSLTVDMGQFLAYFDWIIEHAPLQLYVSAHIFTPTESLTRKLFKANPPSWILSSPAVPENWKPETRWKFGRETSSWPDRVAYSHDWTITATQQGPRLSIFDIITGEMLVSRIFKPFDEKTWDVRARLALSQDKKALAIRGMRKAHEFVDIWDVETLRENLAVLAHPTMVTAMLFSPTGEHFVAGCANGHIQVWYSNGWREAFKYSHKERVTSVAFSPDGTIVATGSFDKTIILFNLATASIMHTLDQSSASPWATRWARGHEVIAVCFSLDGKTVSSISDGGIGAVWEVSSGEIAHRFTAWDLQNSDDAQWAVFSADGRLVAVYRMVSANSKQSTLTVWETSNSQLIFTETPGYLNGPAFTFSPDASLLVHDSGLTRDLSSHLSSSIGRRPTNEGVVKFSADGSLLVSVETLRKQNTWDRRVTLWDVATATQKLDWPAERIDSVSFLADGNILYTWEGFWVNKKHQIVDSKTGEMTKVSDLNKLRIAPSEAQDAALPSRCTYDVRPTRDWIVRNGQRALWLPPEYRPEDEKFVAWSPMQEDSNVQALAFYTSEKGMVLMKLLDQCEGAQQMARRPRFWRGLRDPSEYIGFDF